MNPPSTLQYQSKAALGAEPVQEAFPPADPSLDFDILGHLL